MTNPEQLAADQPAYWQSFLRCFGEYSRNRPDEVQRIARERWATLPPHERDNLHLFALSTTDGTPTAIAAVTRTVLIGQHLEEQYALAQSLEAAYAAAAPE